VESLAKKYDERYKAAADVNTLTGSRKRQNIERFR
jgi:hypothetical protein